MIIITPTIIMINKMIKIMIITGEMVTREIQGEIRETEAHR